ncbi:hypothetical protein [Caulobacter sp. LjRoot300]|uniref:hypothetical protein n=1 Tax=Caulobacter sp. LjRoot300 TaxID=3342321 RepID=UPI003ECD7DEF
MRSVRLFAAVGAAAGLGACPTAPAYAPPTIAVAPAFKDTGPCPPPATPEAEAQTRGAWWAVYGDPTLNDLEARAARANPSLAALLSRPARPGGPCSDDR